MDLGQVLINIQRQKAVKQSEAERLKNKINDLAVIKSLKPSLLDMEKAKLMQVLAEVAILEAEEVVAQEDLTASQPPSTSTGGPGVK